MQIRSLIRWLMPTALRMAARLFPSVRENVDSEHWVIQLRLRDNSLARQLHFRDGTVFARWGRNPEPDAEPVFMGAATARQMLVPTSVPRQRLAEAITQSGREFRLTEPGCHVFHDTRTAQQNRLGGHARSRLKPQGGRFSREFPGVS